MPHTLHRLILCILLLQLGQWATAQADLSVRAEFAASTAEANDPLAAKLYVVNEGAVPLGGGIVEVRLTRDLFFMNVVTAGADFDAESMRWRLPLLAPGESDSIEVAVQPSTGGVHTLTAELVAAEGDDWDSTPGNGASNEDDQRDACVAVPIRLACGQRVVLSAPEGYETYTWYRNDTALDYATTDTLHPSVTGSYRYTLDGGACTAGNCCPVEIEREACGNDLALVATVAQGADGAGFYDVTVTVYNEGGSAVSGTDIYLTTSPYLRLADQRNLSGWQITSSRIMYTHDQVIEPGGEAVVVVGFQAIGGGDLSDYRVFGEISAFRSGTRTLEDVDSTPDDDPTNDLVVDDGRSLSRDIDEDDSDIAVLNDCAPLVIDGPRNTCFGEPFTLIASNGNAGTNFSWSGGAEFSCRECPAPQITAAQATTLYLTAVDPDGCRITEAIALIGCEDSPIVATDTFRLEIEVEEPLFLSGLDGFNYRGSDNWQAAAGGFYNAFATIGTRTATFSDAGSPEDPTGGTREYIYIIDVVEYACVPLFDESGITTTTTDCSGRNIALGLRRPGLATFSTLGYVSATSTATGERAGARYPLDGLPLAGIGEVYTVTAWPGMPAAVGLRGNMQAIVAQLRRSGEDAYVDWTENALYVGGGDLGAIQLQATQGPRTLASPVAVLPTYGRMYVRPGTALVDVESERCGGKLSVRLECKRPPIIIGGDFEIELGGGILFPFIATEPGGVNLPEGFAYTARTWKPEGVRASVLPDSSGVRFTVTEQPSAALAVGMEACNDGGDCIRVEHTLTVVTPDDAQACGEAIWRERRAIRHVSVGKRGTSFALPLDFDPATDKLLVDGASVTALDGGLAQRDWTTSRTYPARAPVAAVRSPFGKTVKVIDGDLASAIAAAYGDAEVRSSSTEVTVVGGSVAGGLYARAADDTWGPVRPLAQATTKTYVVNLSDGEHELTIERLREGGGVCRDTIAVKALAAETVRFQDDVALRVGETGRYCLPAPRQGGTVVGVVNDCEDASGELIVVTWESECAVLEAYESGTEQVCLRRLYLDGDVDIIHLDVSAEALPELDVIADRDTLEFGQFKVIEILANDSVTDEPLSLSLVSEPYFGRAQVVGNAAVEYLHSGSDCATDVFTYEVCQGEVCDSTTVELVVYCNELLIYNGLSPNGDGVNEKFVVLGLGQYPDHEISIFDREGRLLISMREYANDWDGSVSGGPLNTGTYFYVIDLGNGDARSGYLQITR